MEFCPELGISIPVGKDSTSMSTSWRDEQAQEDRKVTAPLSVIISAFVPVKDTRHWTPALRRPEEDGVGETVLIFVDLSEGHKSMGGSALAQTFAQIGDQVPDIRKCVSPESCFFSIFLCSKPKTVFLNQVRLDYTDLTMSNSVQLLKDYFDAIEQLHEAGIVLGTYFRVILSPFERRHIS